MRYSNEPFFWALFSAGGVVNALLIPVLIVVTGILVPAEAVEFSRLEDLFTHPLVRLVVFGVAFLSFMHWANRFRHTLVDMGLKSLRTPISIVTYLAALAGSVWAAVVLVG